MTVPHRWLRGGMAHARERGPRADAGPRFARWGNEQATAGPGHDRTSRNRSRQCPDSLSAGQLLS